MDTLSTIWLLVLGFGLGLKHAIEADHLAAVSTIVSERKSVWSASLVGGLWGIGHTISLFIAGVLVIIFRFEISDRLALALEFCVALMLVALGINSLRKVARAGQIHLHMHRHGNRLHAHPHLHDESAIHNHGHNENTETHTHHDIAFKARPLIVGMIHGLAGSGAVMLLVLSTISSRPVGLTYIFIFGIGSIGGMMLMSILIGLPIQLTANRFKWVEWTVRGGSGLLSLGFGLFLAYDIGFSHGLFQM